MGWREDQNATKSAQSSARQRNAIEMAVRWRADNGPPLNAIFTSEGFVRLDNRNPW